MADFLEQQLAAVRDIMAMPAYAAATIQAAPIKVLLEHKKITMLLDVGRQWVSTTQLMRLCELFHTNNVDFRVVALEGRSTTHHHSTIKLCVEVPVVIAQSAIRVGETTHTLPRPAKHDAVIRHIIVETGLRGPELQLSKSENQGFIGTDGLFYSRQEAYELAVVRKQLIRDSQAGMQHKDTLYSEDLW